MLARIRASHAALSPSEQRVAELVLADPRGFAASPVGALAERAQVSKPTVLRFCRSLGFEGLTDFKRTLAGSVNEGVPFVHRAVEQGDAPGEVVVKVLDNAVASCSSCATMRPAGPTSRRSRHSTRPAARARGSSSTASAIRASWRRTRSSNSFASACRRAQSATATFS